MSMHIKEKRGRKDGIRLDVAPYQIPLKAIVVG